jgi:hypothetical protein
MRRVLHGGILTHERFCWPGSGLFSGKQILPWPIEAGPKHRPDPIVVGWREGVGRIFRSARNCRSRELAGKCSRPRMRVQSLL